MISLKIRVIVNYLDLLFIVNGSPMDLALLCFLFRFSFFTIDIFFVYVCAGFGCSECALSFESGRF